MNYYCCVPQCSSWVKKQPELSYHVFPKENKNKVLFDTEHGNREMVDVRQAWIKRLKINKNVTDYMRVCSLHFTERDYYKKGLIRRRLKSLAIPSTKLPIVSSNTIPRSRIKFPKIRLQVSSDSLHNNKCDGKMTTVFECEDVDESKDPTKASAETMLAMKDFQRKTEDISSNPQIALLVEDFGIEVNTQTGVTSYYMKI